MAGLFDSENTLITRFVNVISKKDTMRIENRLLDGSFHVQILGQSADVLDVTLYAQNENVKERVSVAESLGEKLRITLANRSWIGVIREPLVWTKTAGTYSTSCEFLVTGFQED